MIKVMKKVDEFITGVFVSTVIGLALSYTTILFEFIPDISFLESVAVYHFWIHFANWAKSFSNEQEE
jgi:hypothetical protein